MKYINTFSSQIPVSQVALGCMRIGNMTEAEADRYLSSAVDLGYNYFDHADIYGGGTCETVFGKALKANPSFRDKIVLQTKCGIRKGMYDFSKEHIVRSVEGSLQRLGVEKIDVLLLHRPDLLMEPEEVAAAFDRLQSDGKVTAFGVSNHNPAQIEYLQRYVDQPLIINQVQLSITHAWMIASGANVDRTNNEALDRDGSLRDYCRLHGITVQPWSPLQHGTLSGTFLGHEACGPLNQKLDELAGQYGVSSTGIAIAWLLRLPEKMQPVVGSTSESRLRQIAEASDLQLTRQEWYDIYRAAGYRLP